MSAKMLLGTALSAAVPLHMAEVGRWTVDTRLQHARAAGEILACFGDCLQFRPKTACNDAPMRDLLTIWMAGDHAPKPSPRPGEVFNALAIGLACVLTLSQGDAKMLVSKDVWRLFETTDERR